MATYRLKVPLPPRMREILEEIASVGNVFQVDAAQGVILVDVEPVDEYDLAMTVRDLRERLDSTGSYDIPVELGRPPKVEGT